MRVLLIGSKEYPFNSSRGFDRYAGGGIENHVEKLAKYLAKEGHEPFVITRRFPGQKEFEQEGNVRIYRTGFWGSKYLRNFTYNLGAYRLAKRIVREEHIDLIHSHAVVAGYFGSRLSEKTGVPMVYTPHGCIIGWKFPVSHILHVMEGKTLKAAKKVLFISKNARQELGHMVNKSTLLTNAIDLDDYSVGRRTWKNVRFLFLGRFLRFKGIVHSLLAFERLIHEFPDAEFFVAGDGEARQDVETFAKKYGQVHYLGWVSDVQKQLLHTDVFLLPTRERGQPIALLEAMATGKIILTSLDFIRDGQTGIIVDQDVDELYEKMVFVCKNFPKASLLGRNARNDIEKNFSWNNVIRQFLREYKSVVN
jgi:glycosyltransferase involved in cell wall biosynthesis